MTLNAYLVEKTAKNFPKSRSNSVLYSADRRRSGNSDNSFFLKIKRKYSDDTFRFPMNFLNLDEENVSL